MAGIEKTIELRRNRPDYSELSDQEIWDHVYALYPVHRELFQEHIFVTTLVTVPALARPEWKMEIAVVAAAE